MPDWQGLAVAWWLLHLAIGAAGTWMALGYARRRGLYDQPGERRSHVVATPRGGGVSIVAALLLAIALLAARFPDLRLVLLAGGAGLALVAMVGWIDDHRALSPWSRLAVHGVAAVLLSAALLAAGHGVLVAATGLVAVMVLVNVWNFMDGIDGLAASQAAIAGLGYALVTGSGAAAALALAIAAACCGFLPFNFPRARIFLGDVGSGALGQVLALVAVVAMIAGVPTRAWPLLLLPLGAFLVDATLTLLRRMLRGEAWWTPHVQHAYQVWSRKIGGHAGVTLAYGGFSLLGVALMLLVTWSGSTFIIVTAVTLGWCLVGGLGWALLQTISPRTKDGRAPDR